MSKQAKFVGDFHTDLIGDDWPDAGIVVVPIGRTWFVAALVLIVAAIGAEINAKRFDGIAMTTMARSGQAMSDSKQFADLGMFDEAQASADEAARLREFALRNPGRSGWWHAAGLGLLLLAAGCWSVSVYRCERRLPVLLPVLFACYVLFFMLLV
jgi:hypothetical protein